MKRKNYVEKIEIKDKRLQLVITQSLYKKLIEECRSKNISVNGYIQQLIENDLKRDFWEE